MCLDVVVLSDRLQLKQHERLWTRLVTSCEAMARK